MSRPTPAASPSRPPARAGAAVRSPRGYFSERERQVLQLLQAGTDTAEICERLGVNRRAVRFVHDRLKEKLGFGDLSELREITAQRALVGHVAAGAGSDALRAPSA